MRSLSPWIFSVLCLGLVSSPALAGCSFNMSMDQAGASPNGGNIWTDPGRGYGGWFWLAGYGNNLINTNSNEAESGIDSGVLGGVPVDPTPRQMWLTDYVGDGSVRMIVWNWASGGLDGCADVNGNNHSDPEEVIAALIVDDRGEEYAMISVAGNWYLGWDLGKVNNGVASMYGGAQNGVPMTPIPRPTLGVPREAAGGRVEVDVTPPSPRDIPTYDDVGGSRNMVQGFHILQNDLLLAEVGAGGGSVAVKATPGEELVLRTIFGYPGDAGFYVDSSVRVPAAGQEPEPPPEEPGRSDEAPGGGAAGQPDEPGGPPEETPGQAAQQVVVPGGVAAGQGEEEATDEDGDEILDDEDNCPDVANPEQEDMDQDGVGDFCDSCPFDSNEDQADGDDDGLGDTCDPCPADPDNVDGDGDGACDPDDNCPAVPNAGQEDMDGDGLGDVCDDSFDPYTVTLELPGSAATRGNRLEVLLAITNRGVSPRKANVRMVWIDGEGAETEVGEGPDCLESVPLELELGAGEGREWECSWTVPASLAAGKGTLRLELVDAADAELEESAESGLTLR